MRPLDFASDAPHWTRVEAASDPVLLQAWIGESRHRREGGGRDGRAAGEVRSGGLLHGGRLQLHLSQQLPHIGQEGGVAARNVRENVGSGEGAR